MNVLISHIITLDTSGTSVIKMVTGRVAISENTQIDFINRKWKRVRESKHRQKNKRIKEILQGRGIKIKHVHLLRSCSVAAYLCATPVRLKLMWLSTPSPRFKRKQ